jgi:hypothetical protein
LQRNFLINQQDVFHFRLKLGIALLEIILDPIRVQFLRGKNALYGGLHGFGQRRMPGLLRVLANMQSQQTSRP